MEVEAVPMTLAQASATPHAYPPVVVGPDPLSLPTASLCCQACSLRKQVLDEKALKRYGLLQRDKWWFRKQYDQGSEALALARQYDHPPMAVFRGLLAAQGYGKTVIKRLVKADNPNELTERDLQTRQECEAADMVTCANQCERQEAAEVFEVDLCEELRRFGQPFTTEAELRAKQVAEAGEAWATPDLLFDEPIVVSGSTVAWVDAKNFYGSSLGTMRAQVQAQADKYADRWGPGMIVFALGFAQALQEDLTRVIVVGFKELQEAVQAALPAAAAGEATKSAKCKKELKPTKRKAAEVSSEAVEVDAKCAPAAVDAVSQKKQRRSPRSPLVEAVEEAATAVPALVKMPEGKEDGERRERNATKNKKKREKKKLAKKRKLEREEAGSAGESS